MMTTPVVTVPVKSAWTSKVNWLAVLTAVGSLVTALTPILPVEWRPEVTAAVATLGSFGTLIARTFFTTAVTPGSLTSDQRAAIMLQ